MDNFAVFITTHGRPQCLTYHTLRSANYTGQMFCVVDTTDKKIGEYKENFGDNNVLVFDKMNYVNKVDKITNEQVLSTVLYARLACYDFARKMNIESFIIADDDITLFKHRVVLDDKLKSIPVTNFDVVLTSLLDYFNSSPISVLGIADAGIYFGGKEGVYKQRVRHMFSVCYLCKTNDEAEFKSICFEDMYSSIANNRDGKVCFEILDLCQVSEPMGLGTTEGGTTEFYRNNSLYKRSFYDIIAFPDCLYLDDKCIMRRREINMVPKIISSRYKKER